MSFQVRVLALVMFVALSATGATAWLAYRVASAKVSDSQTAREQKVDKIVRTLSGFGRAAGGWTGVAPTVTRLARSTGKRIRVVNESGAVVVDTDLLAGRTARPVTAAAIRIDTRPKLTFGPDQFTVALAIADSALLNFRLDGMLAACLTAAGVSVDFLPAANGVPRLGPLPTTGPALSVASSCRKKISAPPKEWSTDLAAVNTCDQPHGRQDVLLCLGAVFANRTEAVTAAPVLLYIGARGDNPNLPTTPAIAAVASVMVFAAFGTGLLSRRILRPIRALTTASQQIGAGDLTRRVPERGGDQVAELARTFNRMATSLQQSEVRQRQIVADVAHELRTPLSNVRGYLEGLTDGIIDPQPDVFASLHDETMLQQRILDDLRDLALAEAGTLGYRRGIVDLTELVHACRTAHLIVAQSAGIELVTDDDGPVYVDADPDRLRQVINNLVSNAVRYTPDGGLVTLRTMSQHESAVVQVSDTGTGIGEDDLAHLFDRFWRADSARSQVTGGSGLGLSIARQITVDHGGTISVASAPGVGTTFTVVLPLASAAESRTEPDDADDLPAFTVAGQPLDARPMR